MIRDQKLYCSFCGKSQHECEWLLAGPYPAVICETCIEDGAAQLAQIRQDKIKQDALIMEAKRCAFCLPTSIACEGGFNGR